MAYSVVGIANLALQKIGAKSRLASLTDGTPNAIKVTTVWEYILNEVLEAVKPKFSTLRVALSQSVAPPVNADAYLYAYPLPADYICLAEGKKDDPSIYPLTVAPYSIEILSGTDETLCLMTNYDSVANGDIYLTYIKKSENPGRYTASFINALAFRLAAELTFTINESTGKYDAMMSLYDRARKKAKAESLRQEYLKDYQGSNNWEDVGR